MTPPQVAFFTHQAEKSGDPADPDAQRGRTAVRRKSLVQATEAFVKASPWLGPEHYPAVTALRLLAEQLEQDGTTASLWSQYNVAYRHLLNENPDRAGGEDVDPVDELISMARRG